MLNLGLSYEFVVDAYLIAIAFVVGIVPIRYVIEKIVESKFLLQLMMMKKIIRGFIMLSFTAFLISSAVYIQNTFGWDLGIPAWFAALTGILVAVYKLVVDNDQVIL